MATYPLKVLPIEVAGECQFYTKNVRGENVCYVKQLASIQASLGVMEREGRDFTPHAWAVDCGGSIERCSFLPILFETDVETVPAVSSDNIEAYLAGADEEPQNTPTQSTPQPSPFAGKVMTRANQVIAEFNPFASDEEAVNEVEKQEELPLISEKQDTTPEETKTPEETEGNLAPTIQVANSKVQFKIVGPDTFKKPYQIWQTSADLMIVPANAVLSLPDRWLNKMSRGNVQTELDQILRKREIKIGQLLQTSNGGDYPDGVQAKRLMHAVLAAETWVSNPHTITQMTPKCLFAADAMGAKTVVMTPFDCGTVDVEVAARAQLTAIRKFLYSNKIDNVERLYIVMSDRMSYEVFKDAYREIFYGVS